MNALRSVLYPLRLVGARLGRRSPPVVLVVLGIAAGAAVVLGGRTGTLVAQDRAVAQAVERIPDGSRSVRAVWFGIPAQSDEPQPALDRRARTALADVVDGRPTSLVLFRETSVAGTYAGLGGVERLGDWVTLKSGRLPRACTPERCEVLRLRGEGRLPQPAGLALVEVGEAVLNDSVLFGDFLAPTDNALADAEVSPSIARAAGYHRPPPAPLFLAEDGGAVLAQAPALDAIFRSYAWVVPLREGEPRLWEVDGLAAGVTRARSELQSVTSSFDLVAPVEELREAQATSRAAGRRLGIVGGEAAALLFAFALLAAMTLRTDLAAARRRLAWYGARGWQLALVTVAESATLALAGMAIGLGVAALVGAVVTERAGAPVSDVLGRSVLSLEGLGLALLVAAAATGVLVAAVAARSARSGYGLVDVAAVAAIALVALELARGEGDGDLTLLLPALVTFAAAVLVARLLRPALRGLERIARGRSLGLRLASLSLARNPGYAVVATAFLVVSFGLALFAESYRGTLARGERDQAAHRVPLDYVVREDLRRLIPVQDAASFDRFRTLGEVEVAPVLRLTGGVARLEGESGITLLGIPPSALPRLRSWRDDDASASRGELARRIETAPALNGPRVPVDGRLYSPVRSDIVRVYGEVEGVDGRFSRVELGEQLPERARGGRLAGIVVEPATRLQERGADAGQAVSGSVELPVAPDLLAGWTGVGGAELEGRTVRYTLTNAVETRIRPRQPTDTELVPVLATTRIAAAADDRGRLPLQIAGERIVVRVAGVVRRFPGVDGQAVVGDATALAAAVNLAQPGAARLNEVWLRLADPDRAEAVDRALAAKPYNVLAIESRRALEADARRDPIAHGTLLALAVAAAVALGLALAGVLLTVLGDLRDERGELFDLEAQGASPSLLRRVVRLRALIVALAGLVAGALAGVALAAVVTDLVGLTARATAAEPPLVLDVDLLVVLGAAALYVVAAAALVLLSHSARVLGADPRTRGGPRMSALVELRDLFRVYPSAEGGVAALQGLTLTVQQGELCVVLGPSGSGKSTLLRIVAGFDRPSAGLASVAGVDVGRLGAWEAGRFRSRTIGYADQHYWRALAGELTLRELVGVQLGLAGEAHDRRDARADELLERVGLGARRDAHPRELSGGEQQRVALCAALARRPPLLIADEPTGELDAATARDVLDLIAELAREEGGTALVVSHDPASADKADRVVQVRDGRISDERTAGAGEGAIVVGRGGWLRLPEDLLRSAGIDRHAKANLRDRELVVAPAADDELRVETTQAPPDATVSAQPSRAEPLSVVSTQALEARGLTKRYGSATPIEGLDATFAPGKLTVVTGPSGSGKTTLLHLLAGLEIPDEGEVLVGGTSLTGLSRAGRAELRRRSIAFVGQTAGLVPFLGARENAELTLSLRGVPAAEAADRVAEALAAVGLSEHAERPVGELSAGQRERAALARALAARPFALVADEPTARLDGANALALGALLVDIARTFGTIVVCATHDPLLIDQADAELRLGSA